MKELNKEIQDFLDSLTGPKDPPEVSSKLKCDGKIKPKRKRGSQRVNQIARKHGSYSKRLTPQPLENSKTLGKSLTSPGKLASSASSSTSSARIRLPHWTLSSNPLSLSPSSFASKKCTYTIIDTLCQYICTNLQQKEKNEKRVQILSVLRLNRTLQPISRFQKRVNPMPGIHETSPSFSHSFFANESKPRHSFPSLLLHDINLMLFLVSSKSPELSVDCLSATSGVSTMTAYLNPREALCPS